VLCGSSSVSEPAFANRNSWRVLIRMLYIVDFIAIAAVCAEGSEIRVLCVRNPVD
jgi:hypothetical protein